MLNVISLDIQDTVQWCMFFTVDIAPIAEQTKEDTYAKLEIWREVLSM